MSADSNIEAQISNVTVGNGFVPIEPLVAFVERTKTQDPGEIFSLRDEALFAKHSIKIFQPIIDNLIHKINRILELSEKEGKLTKKASEALNSYHVHLMSVNEQMNNMLRKVASIVKASVEIENIRESQLDSAQLLFALRQIPRVVGTLLEDVFVSVISRIEEVVSRNTDSTTFLKIIEECPFFGKTQKMEILREVNLFMGQLNKSLDSVAIVKSGSIGDSSGNSVTKEQVQEMLQSVPRVEDSEPAE